MKRQFKLFLLTCVFVSAGAHAAGGVSEASLAIPAASGVVVMGSMSMLAASGQVVVKSVEAVGDGSVIVLNGVAEGVSASVRLSGRAAQELSLAAGTVVKVVALSTGHMLILAGKAIAFIPNEVGTALLHQSKVN